MNRAPHSHRAGFRRLPLLLTLLVATLVELALHRVALHFLKPEVLQPPSDLFQLLDGALGPLVYFFASFMALVACTWILVLAVREDGIFTLPWRIVVGLFGCVFLPVTAVGILVSNAGLTAPSPSLMELHPYLDLAMVLMLGVLGTGIISRPGSIPARIGLGILLVPVALFALFSYRTAQIISDVRAGDAMFAELRRISHVPRIGRHLQDYSGYVIFFCFYPLLDQLEGGVRPERLWPAIRRRLQRYGRAFFEVGPLALALLLTIGVGVLVKCFYDPARTALEAGLGYDLPAPSAASLELLGSLGFFLLTVVALAWRRGAGRTVALGLTLYTIAAFRLSQPLHNLQLAEPLYYLLAVTGVLAIGFGVAGMRDRATDRLLWTNSARVDPRSWRRFLDVLARRLGKTNDRPLQVLEPEPDTGDSAQVVGSWRSSQLSVRFRRRQDRLVAVTIVLGEELQQSPDWTAAHEPIHPDGPDPRPDDRPGEEATDRLGARLSIRGGEQLSDRLLAPPLGDRLAERLVGRVDLWVNLGVRLEAEAQDGVDLNRLIPEWELAGQEGGEPSMGRLLALCDLVAELGARGGVTVQGAEPEPDPGAPCDRGAPRSREGGEGA